MKIRVGQGFDVHRFAADGDERALVLGGVSDRQLQARWGAALPVAESSPVSARIGT